jgi:class 3 adenylate cyclase
LNGDLRVAYRTSREGPRDLVFVPNWLTNCEVAPELPSIQGWVEAMTSFGRFALFDGPQRAIRCAMSIRDAVQSLGIEVRAGLHTGGIAVHIGARVSALAGPNDVLVSSTLRDLVIGSGLEFEERGTHALKGVAGEWHLSTVASKS